MITIHIFGLDLIGQDCMCFRICHQPRSSINARCTCVVQHQNFDVLHTTLECRCQLCNALQLYTYTKLQLMSLLIDANLAMLGKNVKVKIKRALMNCYIGLLYGEKSDNIFRVQPHYYEPHVAPQATTLFSKYSQNLFNTSFKKTLNSFKVFLILLC